jgi:predicted NACHT family NTPase
MKTTIDLVIESLTELKDEALNEAKLSRLKDEENPIADAIFTAYSIAIKVVKNLKETEKINIIDSYRSGYEKRICEHFNKVLSGESTSSSYNSKELYESAKNYYKDTFEK